MYNPTNRDNYPTPDYATRKMVEPFLNKLGTMQILEPSAGSGTMLDYITTGTYYKADKKNVYCIESDPELVFTLQGKGYRLLETDFLNYHEDFSFDLILMNPPFSNGVDHLLKAWEVLQSGHIACLLNRETVKNPNTAKRMVLRDLIAKHGTVEELGQPFRQAERITGVDVVLVRLEKKEVEDRFKLNLDFVQEPTVEFGPEITGNQVALNDITGAMLRQYELTKQAMVQYIKAKKALNFYGSAFSKSVGGNLTISQLADTAFLLPTDNATYNQFVGELNKGAWRGILAKMEIDKIFTNGVYKNLENFRQSQGSMALNRQNIFNLLEFLVSNRVNIMDGAIVDVFDNFTQYHSENRCHVEGWKTNSQWKVNRKVILPGYLEYVDQWSSHYRCRTEKQRQFEDIDKVMCWLMGYDYDEMNPPYRGHTKEPVVPRYKGLAREIATIRVGDNSLHSSEFFDFRCFKKGTVHLTFKDEWLWAEFNQRACKSKNWLPGKQK